MKTKYILFILIIILLIAITVKPKQEWKFQKIVDKTIYFSTGKQFETNLYNLKYIGQLQTKNKAPYLILSGKTCEECDENISIYVHSPSDGPMKNETGQPRYYYPGKEYDYLDNKLIFESRMFYGNCLNEKESSIVWVQKSLNDSGNFENNLFILKIIKDNIEEKITKNDSSILNEIIKKCSELSGIEFFSEP